MTMEEILKGGNIEGSSNSDSDSNDTNFTPDSIAAAKRYIEEKGMEYFKPVGERPGPVFTFDK